MKPRSLGAVTISLIYFIFGFLWIFFSDRILYALIQDELLYSRVQTYKGSIYILVTTLLIFFLLRSYISGKNKAISGLKEKEQQLENSISEKEILINELHHRVKNNLQMISSLINLNKEYNEPDIRVLLEKIDEQLFALSALHERLFLIEQTSYINIEEYIKDLVSALSQKFENKINSATRIITDALLIPVDIAVPIGIIINEAFSETIRQSDPDAIQIMIKIEFVKQNRENLLCISGSNTGAEFDVQADSLSINLIRILSQQLNSVLNISGEDGESKISLSIPSG